MTSPELNSAPPANVSVNPVQLASVSDLIEQSRQHPMRWLIPDLVLEDGVHILHGPEESFKTMLTLQLHEVLTVGGRFLLRSCAGGLKTGIAELEMKNGLFGHRLRNFFPGTPPNIRVLPDALRQKVLSGYSAQKRIEVIADWAKAEELQFLSIDSAVKLFPPGHDPSRLDLASDVFTQLQRLPTTWIIAHDRKQPAGATATGGNAEIAGSGRFAHDPDVIHELARPHKRAPVALFSWGKMREGEKFAPIHVFFDRLNYRLYPLNPYLHLLRENPLRECDLIAGAERRYGWSERRAREYLKPLLQLKNADGELVICQSQEGHNKLLTLVGEPVPPQEEESDDNCLPL